MHYICTSCQGVSEIPKSCETEGCSKNGDALTACDCTAEEHLSKLKKEEGSESNEE